MLEDYNIFYINKKRKKRRLITYKNEKIRSRHQKINLKLSKYFKPSIFTNGYTKKRSIYTNAIAHLYNNYFIKLDIKDFFTTLNHNILEKRLYKELMDIATKKDCKQLIKECSISNKGLPLGLITSPTLSNIYLKQFDISLYNRLKKIKCTNIIYTRYADDMIISFKESHNPEETYQKVIDIITELLKKYHLKLNDKKTKFINFNKTKQVRITGITIVEKKGIRRLSIGRNNKRKLFYEALNFKKQSISTPYDKKTAQKLKGKMSFYLSIEKTGFEDFITSNMKKEIEEFGYDSFIEFMKDL